MLTTTGTTNKELLSLHRKALTAISKLNLASLKVRVSTMFTSNDDDFEITVFTLDDDNKGFCFYSFTTNSQTEKNLDIVISTIKLDSFEEIQKLEIVH